MAIIQGHPDGDEEHLLTSLILGVNEAAVALDRVKDLKITLVSPVCQAFKEGFLAEAQKTKG